MQYNNYVTLHRIWAHIMYCIGADSTDSVIGITLMQTILNFWKHDLQSIRPTANLPQ